MQTIDTLLEARWILPVEPQGQVLEYCSLAIDQGRILDILPHSQAQDRYNANTHEVLDRHALLPGLVNTHTHAPMSLLRGLADDLPLMEWLNAHIWPAENRWVQEDFIRIGTQLAIAEMLRGGTTCFNDMYFYPEIVAEVAEEMGMRAMVGLIVLDFPSAWAQSTREYLDKAKSLQHNLLGNPLIRTALAPHAPYTVGDEGLTSVVALAEQWCIPIHMHVHETQAEIKQGLARYRLRPLERLRRLGLLGPALQAVHMAQITESEVESFALTGAQVIHCPESNLKLASGFCPVIRLREAGVEVALGTDGAASNNDLDMFSEMRTAALLAKGVAENATALPAAEALDMATLAGARVLRMEDEIGSLELGKSADVVAVDLQCIEAQPMYSPLSQIVYATGRHQVTDVWIAGRKRLQNRQVLGLDEMALLAKVQEWAERIRST